MYFAPRKAGEFDDVFLADRFLINADYSCLFDTYGVEECIDCTFMQVADIKPEASQIHGHIHSLLDNGQHLREVGATGPLKMSTSPQANPDLSV